MPSLVTRIELDLDSLLAHIRSVLEKDPNAEVHVNPPKDATIKVGTDRPDSASPTGAHKKP